MGMKWTSNRTPDNLGSALDRVKENEEKQRMKQVALKFAQLGDYSPESIKGFAAQEGLSPPQLKWAMDTANGFQEMQRRGAQEKRATEQHDMDIEKNLFQAEDYENKAKAAAQKAALDEKNSASTRLYQDRMGRAALMPKPTKPNAAMLKLGAEDRMYKALTKASNQGAQISGDGTGLMTATFTVPADDKTTVADYKSLYPGVHVAVQETEDPSTFNRVLSKFDIVDRAPKQVTLTFRPKRVMTGEPTYTDPPANDTPESGVPKNRTLETPDSGASTPAANAPKTLKQVREQMAQEAKSNEEGSFGSRISIGAPDAVKQKAGQFAEGLGEVGSKVSGALKSTLQDLSKPRSSEFNQQGVNVLGAIENNLAGSKLPADPRQWDPVVREERGKRVIYIRLPNGQEIKLAPDVQRNYEQWLSSQQTGQGGFNPSQIKTY